MTKKERATAASVAPPKSALSCQAAHPFFKTGAQIHQGHLAHLHRVARIALANIADPEARATLADIVEDAGRVLSLCWRAAR